MLSFSLFGDASSFMEGGVRRALKPSTLSEKLTVQTSLFTSNKVTTSNSSYVLTDVLVSQWEKWSSTSAALELLLSVFG